MSIKLELVSEKNFNDIFKFELENKEYFEKTLPPRCSGYFEKNIFFNIMNEIEEEQKNGECYMYVIRNGFGNMVGRVNFFNLSEVRTAEIGYRIGENESGKGYASDAVERALKIGFCEYRFKKIFAGTSPENIGSRKILEKNNFILVDKIKRDIEINGVWIDSFIYEKCNLELC